MEDNQGKGGIVRVDTLQNRSDVISYVEKSRNSSLKEISEELNLSKSYVYRVLESENFHSHKLHQIPVLNSADKAERIAFSEWYLELPERTNEVSWWSDEC